MYATVFSCLCREHTSPITRNASCHCFLFLNIFKISKSSEYQGQHCEVEITTTTTSTRTTSTQPTTTIVPCTPMNNCTSHYTCGSHDQRICRAGWTGVYCDSLIADGVADCDVFDRELLYLLLSESEVIIISSKLKSFACSGLNQS